jgi:hypothetical protein
LPRTSARATPPACFNAADRLNDLIKQTNQPMVDNLTYCLAMDNRLAQLYVS